MLPKFYIGNKLSNNLWVLASVSIIILTFYLFHSQSSLSFIGILGVLSFKISNPYIYTLIVSSLLFANYSLFNLFLLRFDLQSFPNRLGGIVYLLVIILFPINFINIASWIILLATTFYLFSLLKIIFITYSKTSMLYLGMLISFLTLLETFSFVLLPISFLFFILYKIPIKYIIVFLLGIFLPFYFYAIYYFIKNEGGIPNFDFPKLNFSYPAYLLEKKYIGYILLSTFTFVLLYLASILSLPKRAIYLKNKNRVVLQLIILTTLIISALVFINPKEILNNIYIVTPFAAVIITQLFDTKKNNIWLTLAWLLLITTCIFSAINSNLI